LLGFKAISAQQSRYCDDILISTDDLEIRDEAVKFGVKCPFLRPPELSTDSAQADDAILHAMSFVSNLGKSFDAVMMLQPTSPFTIPEYYDQAVELMRKKDACLVTSVSKSPFSSAICGHIDDEMRISTIGRKLSTLTNINRQNQPLEVVLNGGFFLINWRFLMEHKRRYARPDSTFGILTDENNSIDIDSQQDLDFARFLAESGRIDLSPWKTKLITP
jgi:CMP-N,N'-diacetyllegionaminic acid synthase